MYDTNDLDKSFFSLQEHWVNAIKIKTLGLLVAVPIYPRGVKYFENCVRDFSRNYFCEFDYSCDFFRRKVYEIFSSTLPVSSQAF